MPRGPKGEKRPADVIGNAVQVMRIATGEETETLPPDDGKDPAAKALGNKGGPARAKSMTPERRAEIAKKAASLLVENSGISLTWDARYGKIVSLIVFEENMPIIEEIQDRLTLAFPLSSNVALYRAVQEGSYLADHLYKGKSFLINEIGRDLRGHIRRIGISHQIESYCARGDLPFVAIMKPMPKGNWHWLEICATGALAHVCRTEDVDKFPHEADSRQDIRLRLQTDLLNWREDERDFSKIIRDIPKLYAWLTFRIAQDGRLQSFMLGVTGGRHRRIHWAHQCAGSTDEKRRVQNRGEHGPRSEGRASLKGAYRGRHRSRRRKESRRIKCMVVRVRTDGRKSDSADP